MEKKEIQKKTKAEKPAKVEKTVKLTKKAPSFYRKKYTEKSLQSKIYKKIFIPSDKTFVESFIVKTGTKGKKNIPVYGIPSDKLISKKDFKRLSTISKQIKKQKGRFKIAPFAAVVILIAAVCLLFTFTKNIVIKKGLQNLCESIFEAKCDIAKVDFKFFDASLKINKFEIANKNDTMKDLVYIDSIALDFDLTQALRARFVADELSVLGVESGKERTYDGSLSEQKLKKLQKKKEKEQKKAAKSSALGQAINSKITSAKNAAVDSVTGLFDQYNPETILQNCYSALKTPEVAENVQKQIPELVEKWKSKPDELKKSLEETQSSVQELINFDYSSISSDPAKIAETVKLFDSGIKTVNKAKSDAENLVNTLSSDADKVKEFSSNLNAALKHDKDYAAEQINKISSFSIKDTGTSIFTDLLNNVMYSVLGKYYPYYQQITSKLSDLKASSSSKSKSVTKKEKKTKTKKQGVKRAAGRNVSFRSDTVPSFWIKKAQGSGPSFSFAAQNISSDMNKLNLPASGNVDFSVNNIAHHGDFIVDTRETTSNPLVTLDYSGKNYPFVINSSAFGGGPGTPSFNANAQISAALKVFDSEEFSLSASSLFNNLVITTEPFEPEYASKIYSNVMAGIKSMSLGIKSDFDVESGLNLSLTTDADKVFVNALSKEMASELSALKNQVMTGINEKLNELSSGALENISSFDDIKGKLSDYTSQLTSIESKLKQKQTEIQNSYKSQAENAAKKAVDKAKEESQSKVKNAAGDLLKGLF